MLVNLKSAAMDCYHKTYSQTVCKEETQDCVVPDTLPDIVSILYTSGPVLIRSKDISEGRVRLEANVPAKVAFVSEEAGKIYGMDVNVPLFISVEDSAIGEHCLCNVCLTLSALETRILNPRKISVRAEVNFEINCYEKRVMELPCGVEENACRINVRTKQASFSPLLSASEKAFILTDEFPVPAEKCDCGAILGQNITLSATEAKTVGNKVIIKGVARSCIFYISDEGAPDAFDFTTDFSQIIEVDCLPDAPYIKVCLLPSGVYYSVDGAGDKRSVSMELHAVMQTEVYGSGSVSYLADAYSNRFCIDMERKTMELCTVEKEVVLRDSLRAQFLTGTAVKEILTICAVPGKPKLREGELSLPVTVSMSYKCPKDMLHIDKHCFEFPIAVELNAGESLVINSILFGEAAATVNAEGAELKLPVEIAAFLTRCCEANYISAISYEDCNAIDLCSKPSLTILRACSEDDLWTIAKENCSTVEAITEANHLSEQSGSWSRMILVPKSI